MGHGDNLLPPDSEGRHAATSLREWVALFHTVRPTLALVKPFYDGARPIKDEATPPNVRQHSAFGFLPDPLEAGAAPLIP